MTSASKYSKALSLLGSCVVAVGAVFGLHIDPAAVVGIETLILPLIVYFVPNK